MSKTVVVNLFGGPNTGKSTLQAELYAEMKKLGYKVEMVREVAKKWAWNEKEITPLAQLNIIGEQIKDESELYGKVNYIITDSPIMLGAFYMDYNHQELFMADMVSSYMKFAEKNDVEFMNFIISRKGIDYEEDGRFESEEDALNLDEHLQSFLASEKLDLMLLNQEPNKRVGHILKQLTCGYCPEPCNNNHCVTKG